MAEKADKGQGFAAAVDAVRPEGESEKPSPWAGNGGARPGAGRPKRSHHGPSERRGPVSAGKGRAEPTPPPEPMTAEEAGALLKQLDGMVVMVLRTRPLDETEVATAGKQLAPVLPGVLSKLTPEMVAMFGLAMLYVPRVVEVWATRKAAEQKRKAGAVAEGTAPARFRGAELVPPEPPRRVDSAPSGPAPTAVVADREALAMGVVPDRKDPLRTVDKPS